MSRFKTQDSNFTVWDMISHLKHMHTWTNSCSSLLTSSRPPISSQVMLGTSTTVSLSADGLLWLRAHCRTTMSMLFLTWKAFVGYVVPSFINIKSLTLKSSMVTAREFMTSASMVSSSRSIRSIFFLMACRAASEQRAARSAPTCPWVSLATYIEIGVWYFSYSCSGTHAKHNSITLHMPSLQQDMLSSLEGTPNLINKQPYNIKYLCFV